jgi:hypothetical protein
VPEAATWNCPTCRRDIATDFCPSFGETEVDRRDLTLRGLAGQAFETFIAVDGKLMRSFRTLVLRPAGDHPGASSTAAAAASLPPPSSPR